MIQGMSPPASLPGGGGCTWTTGRTVISVSFVDYLDMG